MKIKIDREKLLQRQQQKQEKASSGSKDPKDSIILKVDGPGQINFRATYYPHNSDPSVEPFAERYYHYGFPGGPCYCPQKNAGEECFICDFVWERLKETKGTPSAREWSKKLPKMCMLIPGLVRDREDEGCKFFRVGTRDDKPSKNYSKIYGWFANDDLCEWLDPDSGFDMELTYSEPDEKQSQYLRGAKAILDDVDLARRSSKFGTKKEFEEFINNIPDVDSEEVFAKKSTAETLEVLNKFHEILSKKAARSGLKVPDISDGMSTKKDESDEKPDSVTTQESLNDTLKEMGL